MRVLCAASLLALAAAVVSVKKRPEDVVAVGEGRTAEALSGLHAPETVFIGSVKEKPTAADTGLASAGTAETVGPATTGMAMDVDAPMDMEEDDELGPMPEGNPLLKDTKLGRWNYVPGIDDMDVESEEDDGLGPMPPSNPKLQRWMINDEAGSLYDNIDLMSEEEDMSAFNDRSNEAPAPRVFQDLNGKTISQDALDGLEAYISRYENVEQTG